MYGQKVVNRRLAWGAAMTSDQDTYWAARLVIDQRGEEVADYAAARADLLLQDGDFVGSAVWRRIRAAIEELRRARQNEEALH